MHQKLKGGGSVKVNKLKGKMREKGYTICTMSKELGMSPSTFHRKTQKESFSIKQVASLVEALRLTGEEATDIFLN